ncbi:hypothetical protein F5Y13DRAFT_160683 [Hypoxylon sp. FL1857]|nr:hypothetical protein F5Y13DRAFT_160683 [Hypoxylon sp. FL1857]
MMDGFSSEQRTSDLIQSRKREVTATGPSKPSITDDGIPGLPSPEYREAPVDVRRRADRTVRAEPPPSPAGQTSFTPHHRRSSRKKQQNSGLGGDDGSDSDDNDPKRGHSESDAPIARRQPTRQSALSPADSTAADSLATAFLTPEEKERMNLRREIQKESRVLKTALAKRRRKRIEAIEMKKNLLEVVREEDNYLQKITEIRPDVKSILVQEERLHEYLDEALCSDMGDAVEGSGVNQDLNGKGGMLEEVVELIESDFISRWGKRMDLEGKTRLFEATLPGNRVVAVLDSFVRLWISERRTMKRTLDHDELLRLVSEPVGTSTLSFGPLASLYEQRIIGDLAEDYVVYADRLDKHFWSSWHWSRTTALLKASRQYGKQGQLSLKYVSWIYSLASQSEIDSVIDTHLQKGPHWTRGKRVRRFLQSLGSRVNQEFCESRINGYDIVLVLFKDEQPVSKKPVTKEDLERLGWFRDCAYDRYYCRYEFDDVHDAVFKVTMNGRVLALAEPENCTYIL